MSNNILLIDGLHYDDIYKLNKSLDKNFNIELFAPALEKELGFKFNKKFFFHITENGQPTKWHKKTLIPAGYELIINSPSFSYGKKFYIESYNSSHYLSIYLNKYAWGNGVRKATKIVVISDDKLLSNSLDYTIEAFIISGKDYKNDLIFLNYWNNVYHKDKWIEPKIDLFSLIQSLYKRKDELLNNSEDEFEELKKEINLLDNLIESSIEDQISNKLNPEAIVFEPRIYIQPDLFIPSYNQYIPIYPIPPPPPLFKKNYFP
jgi:hypothetical protein